MLQDTMPVGTRTPRLIENAAEWLAKRSHRARKASETALAAGQLAKAHRLADESTRDHIKSEHLFLKAYHIRQTEQE